MKKILLATTAVVMTAGAAAADVSMSGYVRFGVQYNDAAVTKTTLEKRVRLNIDIKKESDSGMTMGARFRIQSDENNGSTLNAANAYVSQNGLTLRVGNINGAIESMPGLYDGDVGLTGLGYVDLVTNTQAKGYWGWDAYDSTGAGNEGMEIEYTMGAFTAHLSYSDLVGRAWGGLGSFSGQQRLAGYLAYTFGDWTVALGHQRSDETTEKKTVLTVGGKIGDFNVGLGIGDNDGVKKYAINGSYTMNALTVNGFIANEDTAGVDTAYGIGAAYDIGGASLIGGLVSTDVGTTRADFGIKFSF